MITAASMDEAPVLASQDLVSACRLLLVLHAMLTPPVIQEKTGESIYT